MWLNWKTGLILSLLVLCSTGCRTSTQGSVTIYTNECDMRSYTSSGNRLNLTQSIEGNRLICTITLDKGSNG